MKRICFVCHGNICRSPMAEYVMRDLVNKKNLTGYTIESRATSFEEIGNDMHHGTKRVLRNNDIPIGKHVSTHLEKEEYGKFDHFIGMDQNNIRNMNRIFGTDSDNKIIMLLDLTEDKRDITDPWYYCNFEQTYIDVVNGCEALIKMIEGNK